MLKQSFAVMSGMACMFFSTVVLAQTQPSSDPNHSLDGGVGIWKCTPQDSNSKGFAVVSTEHLPGDWYVSWVTVFPETGSAFKKATQVRYDAARQQYVMFSFDEDGSYGYGVAKSTDGTSLAFEGEEYKADGTNVKFTKTLAMDSAGYTVTWAPEGGQEESALCVK